MATIRVGVVEDDCEIRESLVTVLETWPDFTCDVAASSAEQFFESLNTEDPPDIVLMDIGLPGMSGIEGIALLKERCPEVDILMLTIYDDPHRIFDSLRAGATGYLLKGARLAEIREALRELYRGGAPMSPQIARKVVAFFRPDRARKTPSPLTERECEVVEGLVSGASYKLIADQMCVSIETVRFHIKNIYRKLHVHSKAEVISKSLRGEI
ncbi:MAG: response regulator transcription factor [Acidobacteriota bacterium]|nr:response regulator transcription factor [Acidobacteriota bacterium]